MIECHSIECSSIDSTKCNSIECNSLETSNLKSQQFRLNKISEIKNHFTAEIKERELISKKDFVNILLFLTILINL